MQPSGRGGKVQNVTSARLRQIRLLTEVTSTLLFLQFLFGMWTNLFVSFPDASGSDAFVQIFTNGVYVLATHLVLGFALFGAAIAIFAYAAVARVKKLVVSTGAGLAAITVAGVSGLIFVSSGFQSDGFSFLMAVGFILAMAVYSRVFIQVSTPPS